MHGLGRGKRWRQYQNFTYRYCPPPRPRARPPTEAAARHQTARSFTRCWRRWIRKPRQLDVFRASYKANVACKEALEKAINDNYSDNRLNTDAIYKEVVGRFGPERVQFVLATTIQHKDWDQRFSRNNRAWAQTVPMEASFGSRENDHSVYYVVDRAHSGLTDLFVSHFRKEQTREKEQPKKESILGKLQKPLPQPAAKAGKDKSHER